MEMRDIPNLHMDFSSARTVDPYVGLTTPPRVLTLDEQFPHIEDPDEFEAESAPKHSGGDYARGGQNGYVTPVKGQK